MVGGLGTVADGTLDGLALAVGGVRAKRIRGVAVAAWVRTEALDGVSFGLFNEVRGVQRGISVGVVNSAEVLEGVQVGLVNHAGNNPPALRWTPLVNAHFG
jgi:hypothetical protein